MPVCSFRRFAPASYRSRPALRRVSEAPPQPVVVILVLVQISIVSCISIVARARILLKVVEGWTAPQVAAALDVSKGTVYRAKRRYAEEGLDGVLQDRVQANRYRKLDDQGEAHLIALACSPAPDGHDHWTLQLLADRVVELGLVESLSHETVRLRLKKTSSSRGGSSSGASPR